MSEKTFKIPEFEYFSMGGKYSGCKRGSAQDDFNFRFAPGDELNVQIWYGVNCFDKSELAAEKGFEMSEDGCRSACDWVEEQFRNWCKEHKLLSPTLGYWSK